LVSTPIDRVSESSPEFIPGKERGVHRLERIVPYMMAALGIALDYASTQLGLARGFPETNLLYCPIFSLAIFWALLTVASLALPIGNLKRIFIFTLAGLSFVGVFNNAFVMSGS
jgi:Na+/H+ antiporter NhaD/arsenite permease-like protein